MPKRLISAARSKQEWRVFAVIACAVVLPLFLAFLLVAADMRSDLSDLIPAEQLPDNGPALIGWADLEIPEGSNVSLEQTRWRNTPRQVRMLGYMMTAEAPGAFVLMPEAGHLLHPAHRIPDQMVEVWPTHPVSFKYRSLTWATGSLVRTHSLSRESEHAAYAMTDAAVEPAVQSDITLWFKP